MGGGSKNGKAGTRLVTAGRRKEWTGAVVNPPVWRASTHLYENTADLAKGRGNVDGNFYYGRRGAPTQWALAEALTELEPGAAGTMLYPSGVAAISGVLLSLLRPGEVLLLTDNAYEPTRNIARGLLSEFGIGVRFFDPMNVDSFREAICDNSRVALFEAPGSLTMEVPDLNALFAAARLRGLVSVFDNTWASPLGYPALERGADISLMSLTKHVGGHSDVMMGSASASGELYTKLRRTAQSLGQVVSPDDAALVLRGLRTLGVRLERETASALEIARWLSARSEVARVLCPMLPGSPGHEHWRCDFTGGCGLFSIVFRGGDADARARFIDALELFGIGFSWGGYESLVVPADPAPIRSVTRWPLAGMADEDRFGVRLSIGLEDPADLIADLERALQAWAEA